MVILSVALHGVLLLMPAPKWWSTAEEPEPKDILEESGAISLTTLPSVTAPEPAVPEPEVIEPAEPVAASEVIQEPLLVELPEELPEIIENTEDFEELDDLEPTFEEETLPEPEDNGPEAGIAFVFNDDFPHIAGSASGCGSYGLENCRTVDDKNFSDAAKALKKDLEDQGYTLDDVTPEDDERYNNQTIFKINKPSDPNAEVKYLNVFGEGLASVFYLITPEIITRADLETLNTEEV
ncbi:MAG: hypothetical protein AAF821_07415 [Cyanobacteria bacterium P01_D01_bin.156]